MRVCSSHQLVISTRRRHPTQQPVLGVDSENSADQFWKNIARKKAILIFRTILAKKGNLNLDQNLDFQHAKFHLKFRYFVVVPEYSTTFVLFYFICLLTMCRALFIQN